MPLKWILNIIFLLIITFIAAIHVILPRKDFKKLKQAITQNALRVHGGLY